MFVVINYKNSNIFASKIWNFGRKKYLNLDEFALKFCE